MDNLKTQKTIDANAVFGKRFLESRSLYLQQFNRLPSLHFISALDGEKAYAAFKEVFAELIVSEHQYRWYDKAKKKYRFDETLFILNNNCLVELKDYCEILHDGSEHEFLKKCTELMNRFKEKRKRAPREINLIVEATYGLDLKAMEIKKTKLDLNLFYNDDFKTVDALIQQRLNRKGDKGIVLLHGLPGTGKTTYLRYLIGKLKKRVLFLFAKHSGQPDEPGFYRAVD